ncbi:hypothetical protein OG194_30100 [Streptomyces sp. NBC_01288]|uniref:hypothetical protein n=1 Tax=Streptomyces sp. NBC_01288 TaxID=2903814 RepID=UPI002E144293|nr:hypothetical protein OG194_30100 [Streptomyces sp. NBC_01288]
MRERWCAGAVCAVLLAALTTGCQAAHGSGSGEGDGRLGGKAAATSSTTTSATTRPTGYGAVFLGVDECSSFGTTSFTEVPCTSERAAARVIARYGGDVSDGPACPATTDFVLHISAQGSSGAGGDGVIPKGYACMRNLEPPHPGDPGGGGGPRTIVGDCVYGSGSGQVRETACDGSGQRKPQYKVVKTVLRRASCPASTALYVQLGGEQPVGCARPV